MPEVEFESTPFDSLRLLSTTLNALRISADTFKASKAVNTKYMILIIFCRGSLGSAIFQINLNIV
jgi:hypothetical protein